MEFCSQTKTSAPAAPADRSWQKYKSAFLGDGSFGTFLVYEILIVLVFPLPGRIGALLRCLGGKLLFAKLGKACVLAKDITLRKPQYMSLGSDVSIARGAALDVKTNNGRIVIGDYVTIGERTIINCIDGHLQIQKNTSIGRNARLGTLQGLVVGEGCVIGDNVYISGAAHEYRDPDVPVIDQPLSCRGPTIIGSHVVIGAGATINDGVSIGDNTEIAPDSLVNSDIPENSFAEGIPAVFHTPSEAAADE